MNTEKRTYSRVSTDDDKNRNPEIWMDKDESYTQLDNLSTECSFR